MVPSDDDGDDDGVLNVCDEISSFSFYDDDDVKHHQKNNDAVMTILPSPLMMPLLDSYSAQASKIVVFNGRVEKGVYDESRKNPVNTSFL